MAEDARSGKADTVILLLQEILVDVVGITIPGFCFLISAGAVLGFPLYDLTKEIGAVGHAVLIQNFINQNLYFPAFIALMIFSFVVGHLLYRRDPKNPDLYSMKRCRADLPSGWRRGSDDHCRQFPYGLLKDYLDERGFEQLANYVPWSGTDFTYRADDSATSNWVSRTKHFINKKLELLKSYLMDCGFTKLAEYIPCERIEFPQGTHSNPARRSKHFINIKKLEIKQKNSGLYFDIVKNEAHIRLMSSIWYGARALLALSVLGFVIALIASAIHRPCFANPINATRAGTLPYADSIVLPLLVFLSSFWIRRSIGRFFHYQRVREIVFVLQAYHLTRQEQIDRDLLEWF